MANYFTNNRLCYERVNTRTECTSSTSKWIKGEDVGKGNGQMVGGRYHCSMVRSFDFILGTTAAASWKDIRFTSERHLRYIVGGQK